MKVWVIVILISTNGYGRIDQEVVAGDYPSKKVCTETMGYLLTQDPQLGVLKCVPRRKGMKDYEKFSIGD